MATPKREVSWLERFPPDIWAYFANYLPGEQLGRLLMTGATLVWKRLRSPMVVKSIKLGEDYIVFNSLPRFLNDFPSVEELVINSCSDHWNHSLSLNIAKLPSGVRKLELRGLWSKSVARVFGGYDGSLNLEEHLPHLEILNLYDLKLPSYAWMASSPPSLTNLSIAQWNGNVELPTSLIHFKTASVTLSKASFVSKLPPSLESFLVVRELYGFELLVPLLPPSSRLLSLGQETRYSVRTRSSLNLFEQLPRSLTKFTVPTSTELNFRTNPQLTSLLPSTLAVLNIIPDFPHSAWPLLQQSTLTSLSFRAPKHLCTVVSKFIDDHGALNEVESFPFENLPRSITKLKLILPFEECCFCGPPTMSNRSYFPPQLTKLNILGVQLSPETAKLLPSSLTYLHIGNFCKRVCEHLPTGLKTLISNATLMSPNLIKFLPKSLTFLKMSFYQHGKHWFDQNNGKRIHPISQLADYSVHQKCVANTYDWNGYSSLPPSLTFLDLTTDSEDIGDSFLLNQQLPCLLELWLGYSNQFTDLSIPTLSPRLTTLSLWSSSRVSGKSFEILPRYLTSLDLTNSESIFDTEIQHLPRTLTSVFLSSAVHLTGLCIPDLPPHLTKLSMAHNSRITSSSFPHLPYSLRSCQIAQSAKFSSWAISYGEIIKYRFQNQD